MDGEVLSKKVQAHLESSQNISFLNEFCHKFKVPLPEWKPSAKPGHGNIPYLHGMQLIIMGEKFEVAGAQNKQEAKKLCATAAIEYFEKQGVQAFVNRFHNYVSILFQLCQAVPLTPPEYSYKKEGSGFIGECKVNDTVYRVIYINIE